MGNGDGWRWEKRTSREGLKWVEIRGGEDR